MSRSFRVLLLASACSLALHVPAYAAEASAAPITIPAGDLGAALATLSRQSGTQLVYRSDQLRGARTPGVRDAMDAHAALKALLRGSGFVARQDASGAVVIVPAAAAPQAPAAPPAPAAPAPVKAEPPPPPTDLETVQVTGSRIPRVQLEGPSPITVITAQQIQADGFTSVPDVLRSVTQNGGETQSQQSSSGADFSPGAQQVDLRGLGPNHTLVLVNGRRIADFPLPFKGRSNFTDVSNIPLGMVDRIEILTGSASAVYGSDAISGVVNFILKKRVEGTTLNARYGDTTLGGGASYDLSLTTGMERGAFNAVVGAELQYQRPLWAYDRAIQDSTLDGPTSRSRIARRAFLRTDYYDTYLDPGQATCDSLAYLNKGSTFYASRPGYGDYDPVTDDYGPGYYCGSQSSIGYGTITSERKGVNVYGTFSYDLGNGHQWFADLQLGYHKLALFRDVEQWSYMAPDGNEAGYFYNQFTGQVEYWQRQFSPEEMGGLSRGMIRNTQNTFGLTTGFKGSFATNWDYEASLSHSQYHARVSWPQTIAGAANDLFLGPQLGTDADGFPIFNADPARLYTPLTRAEYNAITADTVYHPQSRTDTLAFTVTNPALFTLPGGDAGFAAVAEFGSQSYALNPDPLATQYYYYSWRDSDGHGSRTRWATAGELRMPMLASVNVSMAGRYDRYRFAGHDMGKFTWSTGLEWRPTDALLLRGSYGTGFRAPDLHYVFAGEGNDETSGTDYYRCRTEEPGVDIADCDFSDEGIIRTRAGNRRLGAETSRSWTTGVVWSPSSNFDISADYFQIDMRNQVQDLSTDQVLQDEANCLIGSKLDGTPVDSTSPTCLDAIARVTRLANGKLYGVYVNPINVARERTSGVDLNARWRVQTALGEFRVMLSHTWVKHHDFQQYPGDPVEDEFAINSGFDIPRTKTSASVTWELDAWSATLHGQRLGRLPNGWSYDQVWEDGDPGPTIPATYRYNASMQYRFSDHARLSFAVTNLFDKMPPRDPTATAYPYYDISWFDATGRQFYLQYTHKFGGGPL